MSLVTIIIIALGLAMDAFAVSIASGAVYKGRGKNHALRMAAAFGAFQALMPVAGWFAGLALRQYIREYDHWVAFGLLAFIGAKMIYESLKIEQAEKRSGNISMKMLFALAVATSIDALAVGITFSFLLAGTLAIAVVIIGLVTFILSYGGFYLGKRFGHLFEAGIEAVGGLVLIGIGIKILVEHLSAAAP